MTASIRFNGTPTPLQVTTGTPVTLTNADDTGVAGWDWVIVYKPPTSTATISDALTSSATITPDVPGSYLIRLRTWADASRTILDGVALGITFIRFVSAPTWRIPAVQETTEVDATEGWGNELNDILEYIQANIGGGGGGGGFELTGAVNTAISILGSEQVVGGFLINGAAYSTGVLNAQVIRIDGGGSPDFALRLYDMGSPGIPTAGSLVVESTIASGGTYGVNEVTTQPFAVVSTIGALNEILDVTRMYELRVEVTGSPGDSAFVVSSSIELS